MPLTCSCDYDHEPEPGQKEVNWWTGKEHDFSKFDKWISKRCKSCNDLISFGNICIEFKMLRHPYNEIHARISGVDWDCFDEPQIWAAPDYICETCGEIYLNLSSVGFECLYPFENMPAMLKDYQLEYAPPKL